jgi:hypothetical protein
MLASREKPYYSKSSRATSSSSNLMVNLRRMSLTVSLMIPKLGRMTPRICLLASRRRVKLSGLSLLSKALSWRAKALIEQV